MALTVEKSRSEIIANIVDYIRSRYPKADLIPGSVLRDLLIEAPATYLSDTIQITNFIEQILNLNELQKLVDSIDTKIYYATLFNINLQEFESIITNIIELYGASFGLGRRVATKSQGIVTFYTLSRPTAKALSVPGGTTVRVPEANLTFTTMVDVEIPKLADPNTYYDSVNNFWYVNAPVQSSGTGSVYNVAAQNVTTIDSTGISLSVTNYTGISGGTNSETDSDYLGRIKAAYTGNFLGTASSILALVRSFSSVKDVRMAYLKDDPNKVRDFINAIDIFVYAQNDTEGSVNVQPGTSSLILPNTSSEQVILDSPYLTLISSIEDLTNSYIFPDVAYGNTPNPDLGISTITFQPIGGDYINKTTSSGSTYIRINLAGESSGDTPVYANLIDFSDGNPISTSVDTRIKVERHTSGGTSSDDTANWDYALLDSVHALKRDTTPTVTDTFTILMRPKTDDDLHIVYRYNANLDAIQTYIDNPAYHFVGQDIKIFPAEAKAIYMKVLIQITQEYGTADRAAVVRNKLEELIAAYGLGVEINQSYLISEILKIPGVADVKVPFAQLSRTKAGTDNSDIQLDINQYPIIEYTSDIVVDAQYAPVGL